MEYLEFFSEGTPDPSQVGGKGANLIKLIQMGINVPPGFVLKANSYRDFLKESENSQQIKEILSTNLTIKKVLHISKLIRQLIQKTSIPRALLKELKIGYDKFKEDLGINSSFAVRSSANIEDTGTFSFAGQAKSYLYNMSFEDLINSIKNCWASLFNPSALLYIIQMNKTGIELSLLDIHMAVIIQKMVNAEVSGVLFTANVVNNNLDEIMVNSTWGLGETIANNIIIPDMFILNKNKFDIIKSVIGTKEKKSIRNPEGPHSIITDSELDYRDIYSLNENQLKKLYNLGLNLENAFNHPQDIEWAIEKDVLYVLQSRPITTLKKEE
jgi:pyruvate,water dikinase